MQKTFDLIKVGLIQRVGSNLIRPNIQISSLVDSFDVSITGRLMGQDDLKRYEVSYPADWYQAFKERWFPSWLLKKYPVIKTTHVWSVAAIYPELHKRLHLPDELSFFTATKYDFTDEEK